MKSLEIGPTSVTQSLSWLFLCAKGEKRLQTAIRDDAVILVDGIFLTKFYKRLVALAIENRNLSDGSSIVAGHWYTPVQENVIRSLKDSFDQGKGHVTTLSSQWLDLRDMEVELFIPPLQNASRSNILQEMRQVAKRIPEKLPDMMDGKTRRQYMVDNLESFLY